MKKFQNPLASFEAPDPFVTYDAVTEYYYCLFTCHDRLEIFRSHHAANILTDHDSKVIFRVGEEHQLFGDIWAPEMHKAPDGKWYVYSSGYEVPGKDENHRLFVMGSLSEDPFGDWEYKGKPAPDLWGIDATVYTAENGTQYMCFSHIITEPEGEMHNTLQIRELKNPWTFGERHATLARAEYPWENVPPFSGKRTINEGPFFVRAKDKLFILYSGNGCWMDEYCLGILEFTGGDLCDSANWKKHAEPVFTTANGVYGPGHASFFRSPDNTELWCAYHAMKNHNENNRCVPRYMHIQKVELDENGILSPAHPVSDTALLLPPSGEKECF